jgi:hypothetical protein
LVESRRQRRVPLEQVFHLLPQGGDLIHQVGQAVQELPDHQDEGAEHRCHTHQSYHGEPPLARESLINYARE